MTDYLDTVGPYDHDNFRVRIEPPQGELLPAEERLQNVLKAIEDRLLTEVHLHAGGFNDDGGDSYLEGHRRGFMTGLDIAWSLAKTEILRRG